MQNRGMTLTKRLWNLAIQRKILVCGCHAISPRTNNVLPAELRTSHISLTSFKSLLLQYYKKALNLYDVDYI